MKSYEIYCKSKKIADGVIKADSFFKRLSGLMFKKRLKENDGLILTPCNQIHTFFMNFPIDAVFIDKNCQILHIEKNMQPFKIGVLVKPASCVIELAGGEIEKNRINVGDFVEITRKGEKNERNNKFTA